MVHDVRKISKDVIDKAIEASINENQELLERLKREELVYVKRIKQRVGALSVSKSITMASVNTQVPNFDMGSINTGRSTSPFSVSIITGYSMIQTNNPEQLVIGE